MSAVGESIVREFFELNGFLVCQHRKYAVMARAKTADEEIDFLVHNPHADPAAGPPNFIIGSDDLKRVARAIVVKPWHTERFGPSVVSKTQLLKFVEKRSLDAADRRLGHDGPLLKLLVLPDLPASESLKSKTIELLRTAGVDAVIIFRTMLLELIGSVEVNRNYAKSDLLQIIRLLKLYHLLKSPQLDLFARKRGQKPETSSQ